MSGSENTLFSLDTQKQIDGLEVTKTERIVYDYHITINGKRFDAEDVFNTLIETCGSMSNSYINSPRMVEALKSLHVIEHGGSGRWAMSAAKGPNYNHFMRFLANKLGRNWEDWEEEDADL